jgi:hypothetical protein
LALSRILPNNSAISDGSMEYLLRTYLATALQYVLLSAGRVLQAAYNIA